MENKPVINDPSAQARKSRWPMRFTAISLIMLAVGTVWISSYLLTKRFTETTRNRAEIRNTLYSSAITSELQRNRVVPLLLSRDPVMIVALNSDDFTATSQRLILLQEEIGAAAIRLLDETGRVVAASDRAELGENLRSRPYFIAAQRANDTVFNATQLETGAFLFTYARRIQSDTQTIGVVVVEIDLRQFESRWRSPSEAVLIANSEGTIVIATDPRWRSKTVDAALVNSPPSSAFRRAFELPGSYWEFGQPDAYFGGEAVMRTEARIPFRGWRLVSFSSYASVRERVTGFLAVEIMVFAILLSILFYRLSHRATAEARFFRRETEDLRALNIRLSREIAERKKVEKNLEVAEQSLAQSQKLAALGEMSAAVSHELNQPLAAMKTYLAGAKLLLQRKRPDEAVSSFQRIDDLIDRMGAITRQLKSYARKGGEELEPVDLRSVVSASLSMMEPQLKRGDVRVVTNLTKEPVMVMADNIRLEQVIINLFRNALDATKITDEPMIEILLTTGETATLSLHDNGEGIKNLDDLFEPFYTTKQPGEGVGLGLAISSGIINDLGGRLTARNGEIEGAVFEIQLPLIKSDHKNVEAAE